MSAALQSLKVVFCTKFRAAKYGNPWIPLLRPGSFRAPPVGTTSVACRVRSRQRDRCRDRAALKGCNGKTQLCGRRPEREMKTDEQGLFTFIDVEPGQYELKVEHNLVVQAGGRYNVPFPMVHAAVVNGRVYDTNRQPVTKAEIQLLTSRYDNTGERALYRLTTAPPVNTDDRGEYRFDGVPPGDYYVKATYRSLPANQTGLVVQANNVAATYYPGVTSPEARTVRVAAGADVQAIDFSLPGPMRAYYVSAARLGTEDILGRVFEINGDTTGPLVVELSDAGGTIAGVVTDRGGTPVAGAQIVLVPPINLRLDQTAYKTATTNEQGRFTISAIRPAVYTAFAFTRRPDAGALMNSEFMVPYLNFGVPVEISKAQIIRQDLTVIELK